MALFIFTKDLRLHDNPALADAIASGLQVYPIFVMNDSENKHIDDLTKKSIPEGTMVFTEVKLTDVVKKIIKTGLVKEIYANDEHTGMLDVVRTGAIKLKKNNSGITLLTPGTLKTQAGGFFKKFTPFRNKFLSIYNDTGIKKESELKTSKLPKELGYTVAGKTDVRENALKMLNNVKAPDPKELLTSKTSGVSPYLAVGVLSPREVYTVFKKKKYYDLVDGLIWRDFYYNIAVGYPEVLNGKHAFRKELNWWYRKATDKPYILWTQGKTGFPVVDACMRELNETGDLCGRGRMIVGSFLTKTLLVDWRLGEKWFAKKLVDYDPVLNNGNWQWVAGCGADVQRYVRIFSPTNQGIKHDPDCSYVKKWVPEMAGKTPKEIYKENSNAIVNFTERRKVVLKLFSEL